MTDLGDPYEGADPRLAWMLRVLSDEFGMLGVMETQQAAYYYANTKGRIDHRLGPQSDEPPEESTPEELQCGAWGGCDLPQGHNMGRPDIPENHRGSRTMSDGRLDHRPKSERGRARRRAQESDGEFLSRLGTDAVKWAKEFMRLFDGGIVGGDEMVDESLMVGWFANAIEAGRVEGPGF